MDFISFFHTHPVFFYCSVGVLGLLVGSFLNVVIQRLPIMMENEWREECRRLMESAPVNNNQAETFNLLVPRSRCPDCGHKIPAWENIPVISYIFLSGKCSECKKPISIRYPVIETASGFMAVFLAMYLGLVPELIPAILLSWALLTLSVIDYDHQLLPDDITLTFLWIGILINMFGMFTNLQSSVIGAIAGYGILWLVYMLFKILTGKEGMGYGDFKLLAMLGAWLGWQQIPLIIILSSLCGAIIGIGLIVIRKHDKSRPIPFGPYLAMAGWISMLWGNEITGLYNQWMFTP